MPHPQKRKIVVINAYTPLGTSPSAPRATLPENIFQDRRPINAVYRKKRFLVKREPNIADTKPQTATPEVASAPAVPLNSQTPTVLRLKQVIERIGLRRSSVYALMNPKSPYFDPTWPRPFKLGASSVGWLDSEISAWITQRAAARQHQAQVSISNSEVL